MFTFLLISLLIIKYQYFFSTQGITFIIEVLNFDLLFKLNLSPNFMFSPDKNAKKQTTKLSLSAKDFVEIPKMIFTFYNLKELDLSHNKLSCIPEAIGKLRKLEKLNLKKNDLKTIAESLSKLSNLRSLNLNNNSIYSFPESICHLTKLESL
jgi:Leucine-rich repeat (LRR) protein